MIDYKEVRIGNLVMYKGKEYKIAGISKYYPLLDTIEFGAKEVEWRDLEPILIDENWLLKMCFNRSDKYDYRWEFEYWLLLDVDDFTVCIFESWMGNNLKHVHQLQNLVFAITKKELPL